MLKQTWLAMNTLSIKVQAACTAEAVSVGLLEGARPDGTMRCCCCCRCAGWSAVAAAYVMDLRQSTPNVEVNCNQKGYDGKPQSFCKVCVPTYSQSTLSTAQSSHCSSYCSSYYVAAMLPATAEAHSLVWSPHAGCMARYTHLHILLHCVCTWPCTAPH